jgi:type IV secretion system protein VirB2
MRPHFIRKPLLALAASLTTVASQAHAQVVQADPQGSGALLAGVTWLQGTLMGNVATAVAVMAVAAVGFMMLTGRLNWRYGATVILGCFILFGATTIVSGIRAASGAA